MSWRDEYQPGSFRGAEFVSQNSDRSFGRRIVTHEYPGRDEPSTEDLGAAAKSFRLDCFVSGPGYRADRDALEKALDGEGPGLLVHPWKGAMQVVVFNASVSESTSAGGIAYFTVEFGEAGVDVQTPSGIDGKARVDALADDLNADAPGAFARDFDVAGVPAFVEGAASDIVSAAVAVTQFSAGVGGGVGPALRAFETSLRFLPDSITNLLRTPLALGSAVLNMITAVSLLNRTPRAKVASFSRMADFSAELKPVQRTTPARIRQADNQDALGHLFTVISATAMVRAASEIQFPSYDDAVLLRDSLSDQLDVLALSAADAGHDERACAFDALRHAMVRDITQRGGSLQRVYNHRLMTTAPALVIANRLYGHNDAESRAEDVAARNAVRHPGFVPGGRDISVLTSDTAA